MPVIRAGSVDGTALQIYPSYPQKTRDTSDNWILTYKYWCQASQAESLLPATGSAPPGGIHTTLDLTAVTITPKTDNPKMVDIEIIYTEPNFSPWVPVQPGEVRYESDAGVQDANIAQRLIDLGSSESDKNDAINDLKKKTYLAPVPIFRRIENMSSLAWTEANIVENVGKRQDPTGMTSPSAGKWLKTRRSIQSQGTRQIMTEEWAYSTSAWDGPEYENA